MSCSLSEEVTLELRPERPDKQRETGEQAEGAASASAPLQDGHRDLRTWNELVQPEHSGWGSVCTLHMPGGLG